jgi:5'-nucleotidase
VYDDEGDYRLAARVAARVAAQVLERGLAPQTMLNINVPHLPAEMVRGIRVTRLGKRIYRDLLIERTDPRGQPYYWVGGEPPVGVPEEGTDVGALSEGYISVTPLTLDMTAHGMLATLATWPLSLE